MTRTMSMIQEAANHLMPGLSFTVDHPGLHPTGKVPMLDLAVWCEPREGGGSLVRHTYYEKEITSPLVFHGRGATSSRQKIVVLAEEAKRRMFNQDCFHTESERLDTLVRFIQKLVDSS